MGVKLDWEIENEQVSLGELSENPQVTRQRRANRGRFVLVLLLVGVSVALFVGAVMARLWYVEYELTRQLRETVSAESAALRIGDIASFLYVQRSESDAWMLGQTNTFWNYQQLKLDHDVDITGNVLDVEMDENRARVLVEEIVDGQRFQQMWFYWRYEDGWRHVPRDTMFWGNEDQIVGSNFVINYAGLDADLAAALQPGIEQLWGSGCAWLGCATPPPPITVSIMPDVAVGISWNPEDPDQLRVASPYVGRSEAGVVLPVDLERDVGYLLAERLLDHAQGGIMPVPATDAAFITAAIKDWLVGRFVTTSPTVGSYFVESLSAAYGESALSLLTHAVQPESSIAVLTLVYAVPLNEVQVDWREYLQWRLALEPYLMLHGDQGSVMALYDDLASNEVQALINDPNGTTRPVPSVLNAVVGAGSDGMPRAWAIVQYPDGSEGSVTFRLVGGVWLRSAADPALANYTGS